MPLRARKNPHAPKLRPFGVGFLFEAFRGWDRTESAGNSAGSVHLVVREFRHDDRVIGPVKFQPDHFIALEPHLAVEIA